MAYKGSLWKWMKENLRLGDLGIIFRGEVNIGTVDEPHELCVGQGDSTTEGMVVFSSPDNVNFTDNTEAASSGEGSTYQAWTGATAAGAADYIGSDFPFCGFKMRTAVIGEAVAGDVVREYYNGSAWVDFTALATDENTLESRADNIGTVVGGEQVRVGSCDDQSLVTINGVEKYYMRFRIVSDITLAPYVEQIKIHTNRFEVNPTGKTESFGEAIYEKDLVMHWELTDILSGFSPNSTNIVFADGLTLVYSANRFNNNVTDGRGGYIVLPEGLDTSKGVNLEILFTPLNDTAGDVNFIVETHQTRVGDVIDATNTPESATGSVTIELNENNVLHEGKFNVNVQNLIPGEILAFGLKRDGGGDSYAGNIALVNVRATGFFFKP